MAGAPDPDVVAAATAAERILITLDVGLGDIRAYPPGSHSGIIVLRPPDQSATTVTKAIGDLASLADPRRLAGAVGRAHQVRPIYSARPWPRPCDRCAGAITAGWR